MNKLVLGLALLAATATSCVGSEVIRGSGREARGAFNVGRAYTEVSVSSGITVVFGAPEMAEGLITADEKVLDYVSIVEEGGRVKVSYVTGVSVIGGVKTVVTLPLGSSVARIEASSAGKVESSAGKIMCETLAVDISSAGEVNLDIDARELDLDMDSAAKFRGNVTCGTLKADLDSAAGCEIEGRADICNITTDSAAGFRGLSLTGRKVDAEAASGGNVEITVSDELKAKASSGGSVRYKGTPTIVSRDTSSGGSVREVI